MRSHGIAVVALFVVVPAAWAEPPARLRFEPHVIRGFDGVERQAELGRFNAPARHAQPAGDTIELAVVRLKSTAMSPGDPIVFLMGGPGIPASVMAQVPVYAQLFDRLRAVADVILLDQRGTGLSRPALDCPVREASLSPGAFERQSALLAEMLTEIRPCVASWRARGVDPAAYTSAENAADVAGLRDALGANRLNLLAFSYGTEVALTVIRDHGAGVARAVLAGVRGPDHQLKLPSVFDLKVRQLSRLAAGSPGLSGVLRDRNELVTRLERVLKASQTPIRVHVTDRRTQERVELRVGREGLQTILSQSIDSARFPALVVSLDQGDTRVLSRVLEPLYNAFSRGGSNLMARAVNCATGASPARLTRATAEAEWALLGLPFDDVMVSAEYCRALGGSEPAVVSWRPFTSDVPTLFISGSLDSNTPPAQAEEVRYGFSHGVHLVVANGGHETLPLPAVQDAVVDFFRGADVGGRSLTSGPIAFLTIEEAANQPCGTRGC
jgi:pimeloyl-ACP methyl ester carboxylesterase